MVGLQQALEESNWEKISAIIRASDGKDPTREEIEWVLKVAVAQKKRDIVKDIINLTGDNKPAGYFIGSALKKAAAEGQWDIVKDIITLEGDNKPSRYFIRPVLHRALTENRWGIVKDILELRGDNKPERYSMGLALGRTVYMCQWGLVKDIIKLTGDNKPTSNPIAAALMEIASCDAWETVAWELVKDIINLGGDNKPATEYIEATLLRAIDLKKWDIVNDILSMTGDNKPRNALRVAVALEALKSGVILDISPIPIFVGHVLGLSGDSFEGLSLFHALDLVHSRFDALKPIEGDLSDAPLHMVRITDATRGDLFAKFASQTTTTCQSIACEWQDHCFSVTLVKEQDKIHIIYANRGQKEGERDESGSNENVRVYTVANDTEGTALITGLGKALGTKDRATISCFFAKSEMEAKKNSGLSVAFAKSLQKTGNCSIANTNITWHFALADEYIKKHPEVSFEEAFKATKPAYKEMRLNDRIKAFHELLTIPDERVRDEAMIKFLWKIASKQDEAYAKKLLDCLSEAEIEVLKRMSVTGDKVHAAYPEFDKAIDVKNAYDYLMELSTAKDKSSISCLPWALTAAIDGRNWGIVEGILNSGGGTHLSRKQTNIALTEALSFKHWGLVTVLVGMTGDNKPDAVLLEDARAKLALATTEAGVAAATELRDSLRTLRAADGTGEALPPSPATG